MRRDGILVLAWGLWAAGCASTSAQTAGGSHASGEHGAHGAQGERHEHPALPPEVAAFHDVLRPLWHDTPGASRDAATCLQAGALLDRANAIADARVPATIRDQEAAWMTASAQLSANTRALVATCGATPRGNVAGSLETVHTAFHALVERLGDEHR
ncbi:MAG: hypothetical protein HY909_29715 [Deltaproteobacteria bacterium]|nr:hypothetical protein [Deltaproteobacteria bacterium]